jgi:hypothetical protein
MRLFANTFLIFLVCQFGCLVLFGQEPTLKGRIVDSKSGIPIPFATILLKGKGQHGTSGLVSNTEGDFRIPVRYSERVDTVVVSCIGYVTKKFLIRQLREDRIQIVRMDEAILQLGEVEIRANRRSGMTPVNIVRSAIRNIPYNYPSTPESYVAYYRDYQLREKQYINLNEAIVEIFDEGFNANDQLTTKMLLYDYKRNEEFDRDTTTEVLYDNDRTKFIPGAQLYHYGGNELVILRVHDALRNYNIGSYSFVGMLENDFVKNHKFNLDKTIFLNETPLYQISFFTKVFASGKGHIARGIIYIEHGNYAIHKMEYTTYELADSREKTLYDIQLEYTRTDAVMRLNYLSFNNFFSLKDPRDFEVRDMAFDKRMMAMEVIFNKEPSRESASEPNNYEVIYRGKKMVITKVRTGDVLRGEPANSIYLYVHSYLFPATNSGELTNDFVVKFKDIYDTEGRLLNKVNYTPVNQFREIFVQKATAPQLGYPDSLYVRKNMPLAESPKKNMPLDDSGYWMNTPLRPAPEKPFVGLNPEEENE